MENIINYTLRAELYNRQEDKELQKYLFERKFRIKYLGKFKEVSTVYDSDLGMHFGIDSRQILSLEIEVDNSSFILSDELEKSTDFVRRVNYMYDWIQLSVDTEGKIRSIKNRAELAEQWGKIKNRLLLDYKGREIDSYLSNIDKHFADSDMLLESIQRYFNFGLIFPRIPYAHKSSWKNTRLVEFSEYEEEKFEEEIIFQIMENNQRKYSINLRSLENSDIILEQYAGVIIVPTNDICPTSVLVEIVFRKDDIANQWYFKLERSIN